MYRVKVIIPFQDMKENVFRKQNDIFEVDKERLNEMFNNEYGLEFVKVIEVLEEVIPKEEIEKTSRSLNDEPTEEAILSVNNIVEAIEQTKEELKSKPKKRKR